jgi:hypothetical protein
LILLTPKGINLNFGGFFMSNVDFSSLVERWPSSYVARQEIERFTGGIVNSKYLANLDAQGKGPRGRIRVGRKIAYPVDTFIQWLQSRAEQADK